jgi:uncharacterized protein (DUF433 family)
MCRVKDYITIDKEILSVNLVFKGTRVPIQTLFDHLEKGIRLDDFLNDFPTVRKEQAIAVIEMASKILTLLATNTVKNETYRETIFA